MVHVEGDACTGCEQGQVTILPLLEPADEEQRLQESHEGEQRVHPGVVAVEDVERRDGEKGSCHEGIPVVRKAASQKVEDGYAAHPEEGRRQANKKEAFSSGRKQAPQVEEPVVEGRHGVCCGGPHNLGEAFLCEQDADNLVVL